MIIDKLNGFLICSSLYFKGMSFDKGSLEIRGLSFKIRIENMPKDPPLDQLIPVLLQAVSETCEDVIERDGWIHDLETFKKQQDDICT